MVEPSHFSSLSVSILSASLRHDLNHLGWEKRSLLSSGVGPTQPVLQPGTSGQSPSTPCIDWEGHVQIQGRALSAWRAKLTRVL